jgi:hypothetical protein
VVPGCFEAVSGFADMDAACPCPCPCARVCVATSHHRVDFFRAERVLFPPFANSFSSVLLHDLILCGIIRFLLFLLYLFFPASAGSCIASRYHLLLLQKLHLFFVLFHILTPYICTL